MHMVVYSETYAGVCWTNVYQKSIIRCAFFEHLVHALLGIDLGLCARRHPKHLKTEKKNSGRSRDR